MELMVGLVKEEKMDMMVEEMENMVNKNI